MADYADLCARDRRHTSGDGPLPSRLSWRDERDSSGQSGYATRKIEPVCGWSDGSRRSPASGVGYLDGDLNLNDNTTRRTFLAQAAASLGVAYLGSLTPELIAQAHQHAKAAPANLDGKLRFFTP